MAGIGGDLWGTTAPDRASSGCVAPPKPLLVERVPADPSTTPPLPATKPPPATSAPVDMPMEACTPAGLHGLMYSRPALGADAGERKTCRGGADTVGPETYLEVLEALLGRWGFDVAHVGARTLIAEAPVSFFF